MARSNFNVEVTGVRQLTERVSEYLLTSTDGSPLPPYTAGAHVALHTSSEPLGLIVRHYSIVGGESLLDDPRNTYRIAVQREDHSRGSAYIHAAFSIGKRLQVGPPVNNFPLDRSDKNVLLIAGGIGITPIYAMARSLVRRNRPLQVFYAGRNASAMAYHDELAKLVANQVTFHYSDTHGHPDLEALLKAQPEKTTVYVCGPGPMITATKEIAARLGWSDDRVRSEQFGASMQGEATAFNVTLKRSGKTVHVGANVSILDAMLAQGLPILWDCRRGECGLCPLPVVSTDGEIVHNDRYLTPEEKIAGQSMCICVSRVRHGDVVLDA
jgi:ferredoxin-NADP reductase